MKKVNLKSKIIPIVVLTLAVLITLGFLYAKGSLTDEILRSILYGYAFTTLNYFLSLFLLHYGIGKESSKFLLIVLGGMTFRMFFMLILIIISILYLKINQYYFIFTTFILYLFYLVAEIYFTIKTDKKVYKY